LEEKRALKEEERNKPGRKSSLKDKSTRIMKLEK